MALSFEPFFLCGGSEMLDGTTSTRELAAGIGIGG
jgi:hypothetical protein